MNRHEGTEKRRTSRARYEASDAARACRERHRHERRIREILHNAVKRGEVVRLDRCELCETAGPVDADHYLGYAEEHALDVIWLCSRCHKARDGTYVGGAVRWHGPDRAQWPEDVRQRVEEHEAKCRIIHATVLRKRAMQKEALSL
jgi:hypothetical protein